MSTSLIRRITAAATDLKGTFCCGGTVRLKAPIKLVCFDQAAVGKAEALLMPIPAADPEVAELLRMCKEATFGQGSTKEVLDPSYRSAMCLGPDCFSSNFSLEEHSILRTIETLMMPPTTAAMGGRVTAERYKLNVYRPEDFFKSHVDTPRGPQMFGYLVVCLPQVGPGRWVLACPRRGSSYSSSAAVSASRRYLSQSASKHISTTLNSQQR